MTSENHLFGIQEKLQNCETLTLCDTWHLSNGVIPPAISENEKSNQELAANFRGVVNGLSCGKLSMEELVEGEQHRKIEHAHRGKPLPEQLARDAMDLFSSPGSVFYDYKTMFTYVCNRVWRYGSANRFAITSNWIVVIDVTFASCLISP